MTRATDGVTGATRATADAGAEHQKYRRPEPTFARAVAKALGDAGTVLEVRPGTAVAAPSYAPAGRQVTTVPVSDEPLAFADGSFDAALAVLAAHEWADLEHGLAEVRRVTRGPVVLLTRDPDRIEQFWLAEYAPELLAAEARRHPVLARVVDALGPDAVTTALPIPFTCVDGFTEAYYARPERLLDAGARRADPTWDLVDEMTARRSVAALRNAIESGEWDSRHGALRVQPSYSGSLVLVATQT